MRKLKQKKVKEEVNNNNFRRTPFLYNFFAQYRIDINKQYFI